MLLQKYKLIVSLFCFIQLQMIMTRKTVSVQRLLKEFKIITNDLKQFKLTFVTTKMFLNNKAL